jgi:hypothetical protein
MIYHSYRVIQVLVLFFMLSEGGAYSRHLVRLSFCRSVRPLSCPEHNLKTLGDNLLKLHTVVEDIKAECSVKEP